MWAGSSVLLMHGRLARTGVTTIKNPFLFSLVNSGINLACLCLPSCRENLPEVLPTLLLGGKTMDFGVRLSSNPSFVPSDV